MKETDFKLEQQIYLQIHTGLFMSTLHYYQFPDWITLIGGKVILINSR